MASNNTRRLPREIPQTQVMGGGAQPSLQSSKGRADMIRDVRLLHPDAVVVMRNGTVWPYAAVMTVQKPDPGAIPMLLLNPDELTPEGITRQLQSPQNRQRIACALYPYALPEEELAQFEKIAQQWLSDEAQQSRLLHQARELVGYMYQHYPPEPVHLEGFFERQHRALAIDEATAHLPLVRNVAGWFADRVRLGMVHHGGALQRALIDGSAPALSSEDRRRLEANLRQRMEALPRPLLSFMDRACIPLWLADSIAFKPMSYYSGVAHPAHSLIGVLMDRPIATLTEELTHTADRMMSATKGADLAMSLFDPLWRGYLPDADRHFLDALMMDYVEKSPLFEGRSVYSVESYLHGLAKYDAQESAAREYMANLVLAHTMPLGDVNRAKLGKLLHTYFPDHFPVDEPYQGEMGPLLKQVMPRSVSYYEGFMRQLERLNVELEQGSCAPQTIAPATEGRRMVG